MTNMKPSNQIQSNRWVIAQRWSHVQFLSFRCDLEAIRDQLPSGLDLDLFDGSAWLSIVPFYMSHIRFPVTPALPFISLWELNLRTYVTYRGRPGVLFLTLDTDSRLGQWIATRVFHLPYRVRKMRGDVQAGRYSFAALDSFSMESEVGPSIAADALDRWLVERYHLYTTDGESLYRGDVAHEPWRLRQVDSLRWEDRLSPQFGFDPAIDVRARYAEPINVRFKPFVKLPKN
jgi:uncharacterized protein YqjF (DUF2071 family)